MENKFKNEKLKIIYQCEKCGCVLGDTYFYDLEINKNVCRDCEKELSKERNSGFCGVFKHNYL